MGSTWIHWDTIPLGTKSDTDIAEEFDVPRGLVSSARKRRGIPPFRPPAESLCLVDWGAQPLGLVHDLIIAQQLGVMEMTVGNARRRRGIKAAPKARTRIDDWDNQPLGEMPDGVLGKILGVSDGAVRYQRNKRDIPPLVAGKPGAKGIAWENQPLGEMDDTELARRLGVSPAAVGVARNARGISPYRNRATGEVWVEPSPPVGAHMDCTTMAGRPLSEQDVRTRVFIEGAKSTPLMLLTSAKRREMLGAILNDLQWRKDHQGLTLPELIRQALRTAALKMKL